MPTGIGVAKGGAQKARPPLLNQNATNDKNVTKKTIVSSVSVFLASSRTTVHAYNSKYLTTILIQGARTPQFNVCLPICT